MDISQHTVAAVESRKQKTPPIVKCNRHSRARKGEFLVHVSTNQERGWLISYRVSKEKVLPSCFESLLRTAHMRVGLQCDAKRCPKPDPNF
jgi:hypothetical protein